MRLLAFVAPALVAALDISIANVQYSGNGCPQGTVSTSLSSDKTVSISHSGLLTIVIAGFSPKMFLDCHAGLRRLPDLHRSRHNDQGYFQELSDSLDFELPSRLFLVRSGTTMRLDKINR